MAEATPPRIAGTPRSGTLTAANTSQVLMAANKERRGWCIQNQSAADLYVRAVSASTTDQNSIKIPSGQYYEAPHVTPDALNIVGGTTGQAFFSEEW